MNWRSGCSVDMVFNSAVRRLIFVIVTLAGTAVVAAAATGCGYNTSQGTSAVGGGTTTAVSPSVSGSAPVTANSAHGGETSSTCPTQGVGGDTLPPLCVQTSSNSKLGVSGPASESLPPTPISLSPCKVPIITGVS